ncbi:MAG: hypothetical protein QM791_02950 [Ferruginibacter sp.]
MIKKGYWKDFLTQEYLEDLIFQMCPQVKINNITPFYMDVDNDHPLPTNDSSIMYFCQITPKHDSTVNLLLFSQGQQESLGYYMDSASETPLHTGDTTFKLFTNVDYAGLGYYALGWKIDINNIPTTIYDAEIPTAPVGSAELLEWFVSVDNNNTENAPVLAVKVKGNGDINWFEVRNPSGSQIMEVGSLEDAELVEELSSDNVITGISLLKAYNNDDVELNRIELDITKDRKPFDFFKFLSGGLGAATLILNNVYPCVLLMTTYNAANNPLESIELDVQTFDDSISIPFSVAVPNGGYVSVVPLVNGFECPFGFTKLRT